MMKRTTLILFIACFFSFLFLGSGLKAQSTTSVTIVYTGFQGCGGCTVCGADYWCFNTLSSYCGNTTACGTSNFTDPVPAGNIITNIQVQYYSADCSGGSLTASINGNAFPTVNEGNSGCLCSNNPCAVSATTTNVFPCGVPGYNYGAVNSLQLCTGADVCINRLVLVMTYVPANQATPATQPGAISGPNPVCPGSVNTYSIPPVANANSYTWSVPGGWTINSGQGTNSISVTAGAGAGNICVTASNLCGTSAPTCMAVTPASNSSAPTGASANPNPICPAQASTLSVSGGSLGSGANWNWYSGSCGGTFVGSGSTIVVNPSSTTTYYVAAVGTCNTTSCASVVLNVGGTQGVPGAPSGPTTVCNGSTQNYTTSGSAGATSYNWTVPSGAVINSGQGTTSISVTFGSSSGNVCVDATGACGTSAPACTAVTIDNVPLAPSGISGTTPICPGNDNFSISSVPNATGYTWSVSGAGGTITGGQGSTAISTNWTTAGTGTVTVTADNGCGSSPAATFILTVNPLPTISVAPTPTSVCSGATTTLTASGAVNYNWTGGTLPATGGTVTATPSGPTTYTVVGTDANNCSNQTTVTINVDPTPTVSISSGSPSQTVCSGGTITGISFNVTPSGSVTWTNTNTGLGGPELSNTSGTGNISTYTAPNVTSVTTGVITVNATASGTGCPSTASTQATVTITINPLPVVGTASVTSAPCGQNTGCINSVSVSGGAPAYQYSWDNGGTWSASSTNCNIPAGNYPLQVQDQNGCIGTGTITVTSTNGPAAPTVAASSTTACVGDNVPLSITGPIATYTYTWTDATGTNTGTTYTITNIGPAGSYTVSVSATDPNACIGTATTLTITVNPAPTAPVLSGTSSNPLVQCQNAAPPGSITVASTSTITSVPVWYNGSTWVNTGTTYTPGNSTPGTTVYTVIDSATVTGCVNASAGNVLTVTVTVNPNPGPPVLGSGSNNPLNLCQNATPVPINVTPTGTVSSTPVWYNGSTWVATGNSYTPSTSTVGTTVYTVADSATVTGCVNVTAGNVLTVTVTITAPPPPPVLSGGVANPYLQCENATPGTITVVSTGTVTSVPVWYNGSTWVNTGSSYSPPTGTVGTTVYTIADSATVSGCVDASAGNVLTVTVTTNPSPTVVGNATVTGSCSQPTGSIGAVNVTGGTPGYTYQWYNGSTPMTNDTLPSLSNVGPGNYSVSITDANGCPAGGGLTTFNIPPLSVVADYTPSATQGAAPLTVTFTNGSSGATSYTWTTIGSNATTPAPYVFTTPGTYSVMLVASNGSCSDSIVKTITIDDPTTIIIPNVFSPNGDGLNDEFTIVTTGMRSLTCNIINRWGLQVVTLSGPNAKWDGALSNGIIASEGTYYYILSAEGADGKTYTKEGHLTLVK